MDKYIHCFDHWYKDEVVLMTSAFPGTAKGFIALFIFVAWLVFMMEISSINEPLSIVNDMSTAAMNGVSEASSNLLSGDEGLFGFGIISSFFSLVWNLILIPLLFVVQIFVSFAVFISVLTLLPIQISGILIAIMSVGLILSLLKFIIPE